MRLGMALPFPVIAPTAGTALPMNVINGVAFIDEAGEKGFIRNLDPQRDHEIGVLGALVFPEQRLEEFRTEFSHPFERFKTEGGERLKKLHIVEAFKPGNEDLRPMAIEVRDAIFELLRSKQVPIVYCARRMRSLREAHERLEKLKAEAKAARQATHIAIRDRPSTDRVEQDLMIGLALRLDAFAEDAKLNQIDLMTDDMDLPILAGLTESANRTRSISSSQKVIKAFDLNDRRQVEGTISFTVPNPPFELDTKHLGALGILGKVDPLVFATDTVVNALNDHLSSLAPDQRLNAPSSIAGWALQDRVYGVMDDALEDIL
jgi:hypothetical protein